MHATSIIAILALLTPPAAAQADCAFSEQTGSSGLDAVFACAGPEPCGTAFWQMLAGGAVGDFDNDGWMDVFVLGGGLNPDYLFMNNGPDAKGRVTFTNRADAAGIAYKHVGAGVAVGDVNADGWLDLYVTSFGPVDEAPEVGYNLLYLNMGRDDDGQVHFTEIADLAGVALTNPWIPDGFGAAFGDYDLDGDLDMAVAGWTNGAGNRLFRNDGPGPDSPVRFTDVTDQSIIIGAARGFCPRFVDMDGDRFPELLWVADFETSRYFVNMGDGTFSDATNASGTSREDNGMGQTILDVNRDGLPDWYVTSIHGSGPTGNKLYINQGGHRYVERARAAGVDECGWAWGTTALDANHDGHVDIAVTNGWSTYQHDPTLLFVNNHDGTFTDRAVASGIDHTGQGRGLLRFDYDRDGDMDLLLFENSGRVRLFRNDLAGPKTHWLHVTLNTRQAPHLAPQGIGSRIVVETADGRQYRWVSAGNNYLSQDAPGAHFGLGSSSRVSKLHVIWPDGSTTTLADVAADRFLAIHAPRRRPNATAPGVR